MKTRKIRRAILSCSDKTGLPELAQAMARTGAELFASGGTLKLLEEHGVRAQPVERISGSPEAFAGRMKTLSFGVFGGILHRRGDAGDALDLDRLGIPEIDAVVVNFYPFEQAGPDATKAELTELIDIGGPAMVRAAAKNAPDTLVLTDPIQYGRVIRELDEKGGFGEATADACRARAWTRVLEYDRSISETFGEEHASPLRYGENPHQKGWMKTNPDSPIAWNLPLTPAALSYNNILDLSSAYQLASELKWRFPKHETAVIVKHCNPCGVASVPRGGHEALALAWSGDPVSAFGGVIALTEPFDERHARFLEGKFVDVLAAPELSADSPVFREFAAKRKGLKAVRIERFERIAGLSRVSVPGGELIQEWDQGEDRDFRVQAGASWDDEKRTLAQFGVLVARSLKSNAIAIVHSPSEHAYLLAGAGQGQPNRIDALSILAVPRALETLKGYGGDLADSVLVSDAFFPFRDSIEEAARAGIRAIVQPGGSMRDSEVVACAKELGVGLAFTGTRHFRH